MPPRQARGAKPVTIMGSSFSRSYGGILPSSLTTVLPIALVFSTCPPVLVWGTGAVPAHRWTFLGSMESVTSPEAARHRVSGFAESRISLGLLPTRLPQDNHRLGSPILLRPPTTSRDPVGRFVYPKADSPLATRCWLGRGHGGTGISTCCASTTPFGLALAPDLPWVD